MEKSPAGAEPAVSGNGNATFAAGGSFSRLIEQTPRRARSLADSIETHSIQHMRTLEVFMNARSIAAVFVALHQLGGITDGLLQRFLVFRMFFCVEAIGVF